MKRSISLEEHYQAILGAFNPGKTVPVHGRVLETLGYLLHTADETLAILRSGNAPEYAAIEKQIQSVYDTVDELLKKLSD